MATNKGSIICAGLSCLDLQLIGCTKSGTDEAIERYDEAVHCAGGSASMTGTTLALLLGSSGGEGAEEVHVLTKIGPDFAGDTLLEFYRRAGASTKLVLKDETSRTSMAVLPVFKNGKRGCFVNLACNDGFRVEELLGQLGDSTIKPPRAFLFGYPHLLPNMQGDALRSMLKRVRETLSVNNDQSVVIGVDLNGVDGSDAAAAQAALVPALGEIDILHLNEDEAAVLTSSSSDDNGINSEYGLSNHLIRQIESFHDSGCAAILLSLGSKGAFVSITPHAARLQQLACAAMSDWIPGTKVCVPAFKISHGDVNTNGAGDALFSGFCLAASSWAASQQSDEWKVTPNVAGTFASLVAWQRCDAKTRSGEGMRSADTLMKMIRHNNLPETL
ncbi:hypothetical protein ACHAXN_011683 [Cyclotella atomus]